MSRLKTFFKYFLAVVAVYILVDIFSFISLKSTYLTKECTIDSENPKIEITESKSTVTNGYVNGKITNNTDDTIKGKYLKLDCYSPRNVNMGTKYVKINDLISGQTMDFTSKFNYDNVDHIIGTIVDETEIKNISDSDFELDDLTKNKTNWLLVFAAIIVIIG